MYYFVLWIALAAVSLLFIFLHGIEYVAWPRLLPPNDVIFYDGPGFREGRKGQGVSLPIPALKDLKTAKARFEAEQHRRSRSKRMEEIEMGTKRSE